MNLRPIYYDTETTGVRIGKDSIIEIGAFDPLNNKTFEEFIKPDSPIPQEAIAISGITDEMVKDAAGFGEVAKRFVSFCGEGAVLIAHNNDSFDKPFLEFEFKRANLAFPDWKFIDSLKWARRYRPDLPKHSLQFLREVYGIEENRAHRALADVVTLHKLFTQMTDDLSVETILSLLSENRAVQKMPFGKYMGKPLPAVPKDYLEWLKKSGSLDKDSNKDLKAAIELILA